MQKEERQIIEGFVTQGKVKPQDMDSTIKNMMAAAIMNLRQHRALVIANAATATAIRKQFAREEVEIIITQAVEDGAAYLIIDKELKKQLLENITRRGY